MRVTFLGTGNAFSGAGRAQSAVLIEDHGGRWLLECGATTPYLLKREGIDPSTIEMVAVSHLHGDHFAGLPFLLLGARDEEGRKSALYLVGPPLLKARIKDLLLGLYSESNPDEWPFPLEYHALKPGQSLLVLGRTIRAFAANHMTDGTALCLRVESEGKVIAFSGDTGALAPLAEVAEGADLFICECTLEKPAQVRHLSVEDIARLRPGWNARRVVLTHLSAESRRAAEGLSGVEVAEDGAWIEL
jgi:ribonuclease BN (tRNA processing enzyme)